MLVAKYWAEEKKKLPVKRRSSDQKENTTITIRRLGWSNRSQDAANQMAKERLDEAIEEVTSLKVSIKDQKRGEFRVDGAYNGADGLPIREEIIMQYGTNFITRNAYGAECLNMANIAFLDVDDQTSLPKGSPIKSLTVLSLLVYPILLWFYGHPLNNPWQVLLYLYPLILLVLVLRHVFFSLEKTFARFAKKHPDVSFRVYRTHSGYRLLFQHKAMLASDETFWKMVAPLRPDPLYVRMCQLQSCFRARLSPKPWRINLDPLYKVVKTKIWHMDLQAKPERKAWLKTYKEISKNHATCHFVVEYNPKAKTTGKKEIMLIEAAIHLHDNHCKAHSNLPLA